MGDFHISPEIKSFLFFPKFCDLFIIIDYSFACELLGGLVGWMSPWAKILGGLEPLGPHEVGAYDHMKDRAMPPKISIRSLVGLWKFTAASQKSGQNNGAKYTVCLSIYLLPFYSLSDSHCLHDKHQRPLKMLKSYSMKLLSFV